MKNQSLVSKPIKTSAYGILKQHYYIRICLSQCFATCCGILLLITERKKKHDKSEGAIPEPLR